MRNLYMDEAGTSFHEPYTVVAIVIVDGDSQWTPVAEYLQELVREHVPAEHRDGFVFHAADIHNGSKPIKKLGWSREQRFEILESLARIPVSFQIPFAWCSNAKHDDGLDWVPKNEVLIRHLVAFVQALKAANQYLHDFAPDEVAMLISEDVHKRRQWFKNITAHLNSNTAPEYFAGKTAFNSLIDTVHFARKNEAPLLQIADVCAFTIRRYLSGGSSGGQLAQTLLGSFFPADFFLHKNDDPMRAGAITWHQDAINKLISDTP